MQTNDYYAFGSRWDAAGSAVSDNRYRYNGKELQTTGGLGYLDYGARMYDARIGRWHSIDPMAESYQSQSPFHFSGNNPIRLIDNNGMWYGDYFDRFGEYLGTDGIEDGQIYILNEGKTANKENKNVNWGGLLSKTHSAELKSKSEEISLDSDLGYMIRTVYAEMRGGDDNAKAIVAESIYNRSQLKSGYEKANGTYQGIVNKFYDVSKEKSPAYDAFKNPQDYIYRNNQETNAWRNSASASIKANSGASNIGKGVIFYNSASSTYYDKNPLIQKIILDFNIKGIKGLWKLK